MALYFEDLPVGYTDSYGSVTVDRDEVIAFATAYDPQPFHMSDEEAAAYPVFGRLSASGWHTASMAMRMAVDRWKEQGFQSHGGVGGEVHWLKPVYPGDTLRVEAEVLERSETASMPAIGFVKVRSIVLNQHDQAVMRQVASLLVARRPQA